MAAAPSGAVTGAATPSRVVLRDGVGDVWRVNVRTSEWTLVGDVPPADVRRAVASHRTYALVIRTRFDNLRRVGTQRYLTGVATPHGEFFVEVVSRRSIRSGQHTLFDGPPGDPLICANLGHRIDYAADLMSVRIPRSCLDSPKWVRVNIGNILVVGNGPHRTHFADNPLNREPYANVGTRRLYRS